MNGTDLFELMDNIEDKYIADARIKHRAYVFAAKENGVSAFLKNAVSVAAILLVIGVIFVWTLVGKDIINAHYGEDTSEAMTTQKPDTTPDNVVVPPETTTAPITTTQTPVTTDPNIDTNGIFVENGFTFNVAQDHVVLVSYEGNDRKINIPNSYKGKTVTIIENGAFENCESLIEVVIPNNVKVIGEGAFKGCVNLESITIPFVGTHLDESGNNDLASVFDVQANNLKNIVITGGTSLKKNAFVGFESVKNLEIAKTVINFEASSLKGLDCIESLTIPIVGDRFMNSTKQYFPRLFGDEQSTYRFNDIPETLKVITVNGEGVISEYAFAAYDTLTKVIIENGVTGIGSYAFANCTGLIEITIPNSVTNIDEAAFLDCESLVEVVIPGNVTRIGNFAFQRCKSLVEVIIPSSVTSIGTRAFEHCSGLTEITISNGVISIEEAAFRNCSSLVEIVIPNSITRIGYNAFGECDSLSSITIPFVGESADNSQNTNFGYIFGAVNEYHNDVVPKSLETIILTDTEILRSGAFRGCNADKIILPDTIKEIGPQAFSHCDELTELIIPNGVTTIGRYAFEFCYKLTNLSIPRSVTRIDEYALRGCSKISSIVIPNSVEFLGAENFYEWSKEACIYVEEKNAPSSWDPNWNEYCSAKVYFASSWHYVDGVPTPK